MQAGSNLTKVGKGRQVDVCAWAMGEKHYKIMHSFPT